MPLKLCRRDADFQSRFAAFLEHRRSKEKDVDQVVSDIVATVRRDGDRALCAYSQKFDGFSPEPADLVVTSADIAAARAACDPEDLRALDVAAERIEAYHRRQLPGDDQYQDPIGVQMGCFWKAIESAGLYVPGGTAAYPSSVLMNAIPAKVAGVTRMIMVVPAPEGVLNNQVLAAADLAGIHEIYRVGGAQAVAAMAFGTQSIMPVDKIVGPGNAYVTAAKRQLFGYVGIDMIAGPSEILVVADADNDPDWIAIDLLSQAEHDPKAQAVLISDDASFIEAVIAAVEQHLQTLPRAEIAAASWQNHGATILIEDLDQAVDLVDSIAPEHLELAIEQPEDFARRVRNAGAMFLGRYTPEAIGDYIAGPNHVLPTSGSARFSSGLGVHDFLKRMSFVRCDSDNLQIIGPTAAHLAACEGLDAHARSLSIRLHGSAGGNRR